MGAGSFTIDGLAAGEVQTLNAGGFTLKPLTLEIAMAEIAIPVDTATISRDVAPLDLAVPAGAVVESAKVTVRAGPPGWTKISSVGEVRADGADYVVIDFRRMRTVKGLRVGSGTVSEVLPWNGASFAESWQAPEVTEVGDHFEFPELQTERLRIKVDVNSTAVANGAVNLPTAPADLELLIANKRVWFQAGEVKRGSVNVPASDVKVNDFFVAGVDCTEAVAAAAAVATPVKVELRSTTPGKLNLAHRLDFQRVHLVTFPEGPERLVTLATEGAATLGLPLPPEAVTAKWRVAAVTMTVKAKLAPTRILPEVAGATSTAAELVLDPEHAIVLKLDKQRLLRFGTLSGIRTWLKVEPGGAEVGCVLLAGAAAPGEPLPGAGLLPVTAEGPRGAPQGQWCTFAAPRPIAVPADGELWAAIQVSRGSAVFPLLAAGGGEIRRGMPGGPWRAFSSAIAIQPRGDVRLVGEAPEGVPIPAIGITMGGATQFGTPTADGVAVAIKPTAELQVANAGVLSGGALPLALTASAPGAYRFTEARVLYRLPTDQA